MAALIAPNSDLSEAGTRFEPQWEPRGLVNIDTSELHDLYNSARSQLLANSDALVATEKAATGIVAAMLSSTLSDIRRDYDEASFLYPFRSNYAPRERGRGPVGDQFPWIEVGEHAIGVKLVRHLGESFRVQDTGFPTGPDQRLLVRSSQFSAASNEIVSAIWLVIDIKTAGPRDDF